MVDSSTLMHKKEVGHWHMGINVGILIPNNCNAVFSQSIRKAHELSIDLQRRCDELRFAADKLNESVRYYRV